MSLKFRANVGSLLEVFQPVGIVALKGVEKEYELASYVTLLVEGSTITMMADGGRMGIVNALDMSLFDKSLFEIFSTGCATVSAESFLSTLNSFDRSEMLEFHVRESSAQKESSDEDNSQPSGREMIISLVSDPSILQTLPVLNKDIDPEVMRSKVETKPGKLINVRRDIFIESAKRITFAHGWEAYRVEYNYWPFVVNKESVRFMAGSGSIFAVIDMTGKNVTDAKSEFRFLMPNEQTQAFIDCLSCMDGHENIGFYQDAKAFIAKCGSISICISSIDTKINWPNINEILNRESKVVVTTKAANWNSALKGIIATYSKDIKDGGDYHVVSLGIDKGNKIIHTKTDGTMKSHRKITVEDMKISGESDITEIKFLSQYLMNCINTAPSGEYVQFEIEGIKPIIVRYHATPSAGNYNQFVSLDEATGVSEKYSVFFATFLTKE